MKVKHPLSQKEARRAVGPAGAKPAGSVKHTKTPKNAKKSKVKR